MPAGAKGETMITIATINELPPGWMRMADHPGDLKGLVYFVLSNGMYYASV